MSCPIRCEVRRGGIVESLHLATVCAVAADGEVLLARGDVERAIYPRSSLKPFQALAVVTSGAADALGMTEEELAVCCASHWGTPRQTGLVASVLVKAGLDESALQCGAHPPADPDAAQALQSAGESPRNIHNNCSGKHAGMLAVCMHLGWPIGDYLNPSHPIQRLNLSNLAAVCDYPEQQIQVGVDGCSAPTFALPATRFAFGLARLADPTTLPEVLQSAAQRITTVMTNYPELIGHEQSSDARLMAAASGRIVAKGGAEACLAVADLRGKRGIFVKIDDGTARARDPVALTILRQLGVLSERELEPLEELWHPVLTNHAGKVVGEIACVL